MPEPENISGETVRRLREQRGWSQDELAAVAGLSSHAVISDYERGLRPGPTAARKLREAFGLVSDTYDPPQQATAPPTEAVA